MFRCLWFILLTSYLLSARSESVFYSSELNMLFVPEVEINGKMYIKGVLHLDNNGIYTVNSLTMLDAEQESLLLKINSHPCGQPDALGKFSAYRNFIKGDTEFCLVDVSSVTVEGGKILSYLFIENGSAQVITDTRNDTFRDCCLYLLNSNYDDLKFGYIKGDVFVEESDLSNIDFEREYILKLTGDGLEDRNY